MLDFARTPGMGKRMERKSRELTLTEIISRNERIPVDKVDEWVERCLRWAAQKGIIKYDGCNIRR